MTNTMKFLISTLLLVLIESANAQNFHTIVDSLGLTILERSNTIGSYVSIVKGDSLIYSSSFGYNNPDTKTPLTDSTIFPISSNTKAFNSILLTQLLETNQIDFETPIKQYLPDLQFKDNYTTNHINTMDILTHRWGFPRYDFTYYMLSSDEMLNANQAVVNKFKYMEPTVEFRTKFQYGNNQYILAACLLEKITGIKWEKRLRDEILEPLKMYDTHCDYEQFINSTNRSLGYQNNKEVDIKLVKPFYHVSGMGNMFSSVRDLQAWSNFLINGNDSILSEALIDYNLSSHFNVGYEEPYEGFSSMTYGLGWFIFDYFGHKVVLHHGDNIGHQSLILLMPDDDISIVIIANEGMKSYGFPFCMAYSLLDLMTDRNINDWCSILPGDVNIVSDSTLKEPEPPTVDIKDYQGEFLHGGFGKIRISLLEEKLMIDAGAYKGELIHWSANTFKVYSEEFQTESRFEFILNSKKGIVSVKTDLIEPSVEMIQFKKEVITKPKRH